MNTKNVCANSTVDNGTFKLSTEQLYVFNKYKQRDNIFITGPGGVGKSALIKHIYRDAKCNNKEIFVTALTGCAAILLECNARTLHSWAGIGLGNKPVNALISNIRKRPLTYANWKYTNILIIDEISMLSLKLFNKLDEIGKIIRRNNKPFGGIQLIFSGDFYQLPPVGDKDDIETQQFCFESNEWNNTFKPLNQLNLTKIFRQTDEVYATILTQLRQGIIKKRNNELLLTHVNREKSADLVTTPVKLFPTKNKVENINNQQMSLIQETIHEFNMECNDDLPITSKSDTQTRTLFTLQDIENEQLYLMGNLRCDKNIKLKIGAQVMCIINFSIDDIIQLCNGSQGIITGFCETTGYPIVKYNNGIEMTMSRNTWESEKIPGVGVSQIPLILAWALTIHKSQGSTLDTAEIDAGSSIFDYGQTYVALSRVKSLNGLYLTSFDASKIKINIIVKQFYATLETIEDAITKENETIEN
jgi:ATP-dependent DNA helicase PIF1